MPELPGGWSLVVAGSALGGALRYVVSECSAALLQERFPWSTWIVNLSGAIALGLLLGSYQHADLTAIAAFAVYALGSYTTVSAFALQTVLLQSDGRPLAATLYLLGSGASCLAGVAVGFWLGLKL